MNSLSSGNDTNLVNISDDLTTLTQAESKDSLLSFSFDHLYACHSESSDRRHTLDLDKEVEIATESCVVAGEELFSTPSSELSALNEKLGLAEKQNKRLKELLIYHLDLIQQQNDVISKRDKLYQTLKQENDSLKSKLNRMDRRVALNQRHTITNPPPLVHVSSVTQKPKIETTSNSKMMVSSSLTELLIPDNKTNSFIFDTEIPPKYNPDPFQVKSTPKKTEEIPRDPYKMVEGKKMFGKKEANTENYTEAIYSVSGNSTNVIQRIQRNRRRTGTGAFSRSTKSSVTTEMPANSNTYDDDEPFSVNKKSKLINTYGKNRNGNQKKITQYSESLSERFQLIDATPTGEDPYQLGEADMREQSPIPKLMLQKTNQGRMKIYSKPSTTDTIRSVLSPLDEDSADSVVKKIKLNRYNLPNTYMHPSEIKKEEFDSNLDETDLDIVKTEPQIQWGVFSSKVGKEKSMSDFSYGESANNIVTQILPGIGTVEFQDLYTGGPTLTKSSVNEPKFSSNDIKPMTNVNDKSKKRIGRTSSLVNHVMFGDKPNRPDQLCRKRALSTSLLKPVKKENVQQPPPIVKPKLTKSVPRGKKTPLPGIETKKPYHTLVGDPDISWYLGLDPDIKPDDVDEAGGAKVESLVEVPRWREKIYTPCYDREGIENLDDKVFEKRHQKLEAEERRQLRWHLRRVREQRHVERLRQRQRDSWYGGAARPAVVSVWPRPQRDARLLEITRTLPVTAFGEPIAAMPPSEFVLPWVKTSKALKRSKRSTTLH